MEEKVFVINLKKKIIKDPKWRRKEIIVRELKNMFGKKYDEVKIDKKLNELIWKTGKTKIRILAKIEDKKITLSC
ncbi:MAG: hypothetical protein QXG91_02390 [Candidatus Aenigmatarchaeota archaeon]